MNTSNTCCNKQSNLLDINWSFKLDLNKAMHVSSRFFFCFSMFRDIFQDYLVVLRWVFLLKVSAGSEFWVRLLNQPIQLPYFFFIFQCRSPYKTKIHDISARQYTCFFLLMEVNFFIFFIIYFMELLFFFICEMMELFDKISRFFFVLFTK